MAAAREAGDEPGKEEDTTSTVLNFECVEFLDTSLDNSPLLQASLRIVKSLRTELTLTQAEPHRHQQQRHMHSLSGRYLGLQAPARERELRAWGLPDIIADNYQRRGIVRMFEWQVACLANTKVLIEGGNLLYSAPTSAGKTLVAELLAIKTVLERKKKVIIILPFVSVAREKTIYLQDILSSAGVRVEGFVGSHAPPGGFQSVHIAICTIEKANSLVNRLMDEGNVSDLGAIVVDEMHLLGDSSRGYILELLLTKIKYVTKKYEHIHIQIIGMSATLPNLELLANWLEAELFVTDFRPIPLEEYCMIGNSVFNKSMNVVRHIPTDEESNSDGGNIMQICLETLKEACSVLIFCTTKNWCESLAQLIASKFFKMGTSGGKSGKLLREQLNSDSILEVLEQLKSCPVGLDAILKSTVSFGVSFHHAGLTFDERDIIESAFKTGALRILVATSTLSSGVNLPARRVIIRSPVFQKQPINILTYKQMIGRAGRMGKDVKGESILMCTESERKIGLELMSGALDPVKSCIEGGDKFMRAILEIVASQVASTRVDLELYTNCTLLFNQDRLEKSSTCMLEETLACLVNFELIRIQENSSNDAFYAATSLGKACLSSSMAPNDGLTLFCELQKARQCLVLETDLHLIYLVTPYSVTSQWVNIDWLHLLNLWESLTKAMKRVGELVGVQESFIFRCVRGTVNFNNMKTKVQIHKRFYTALALQDLVNEVPLGEVSNKFRCCRGLLQGLQQSAATFAGMVTAFCHQLGWKNIEMLVSQFQDRLHFGIQSELLDLMRLPSLNGLRARCLFNAGYETVCALASADINTIENALNLAVPFQSEKGRDGEDISDAEKRNKVKNIWITGHCGMTAKQAAENLINEARAYLQFEMGVTEIKWKQVCQDESTTDTYNEVVKCETVNHITNELRSPIHTDSLSEEAIVDVVTETKLITGAIQFEVKEEETGSTLSNNVLNKSENEPELIDKDNLNHEALNNIELAQCNIIEEQNSSIFVNETLCEDEVKKTLDLQEIKEPFANSVNRISDDVWSDFSTPTGSPNTAESTNKNSLIVNISNFKLSSMTRDASLFSSDEPDSPNVFDESLAVNTQLCKLIDDNQHSKFLNISRKRKIDSDILILSNENTIKDAFQFTFNIDELDKEQKIDNDDNDNMKLHYDDEINIDSESLENALNNHSDEDIASSQESDMFNEKSKFDPTLNLAILTTGKLKSFQVVETIKSVRNIEPQAKKVKLFCDSVKEFWEQKRFIKLRHVSIPKCNHQLRQKRHRINTITNNNYQLTCVFIGSEEYLDFLSFLDSKTDAGLFLHVDNNTEGEKQIIGSNIMINSAGKSTDKKKDCKQIVVKDTILKGISLYCGNNVCFYIDFHLVNPYLTIIFNKIESWLKRADITLSLHSSKFNYVYLKQCDIHLPWKSLDTSVMEWLIDSDTIETSITKLAAKYCDKDIAISYEASMENVNSCNDTLSKELLSCVKAWAVWEVSEKQIKYLQEQYDNVHKVLGIETHTARILSESESSGLRVDKHLASELLADVKRAQEVLQTKAFKLYGHRFNFNSSKDVAKALGIYKGRKVSTKKSILSAHSSPLASIIMYWRKLNTILAKTLYPLTAKTAMQSDDSRIYTSYVMHTCTGRVCMHEPNLQNVPRNFSIPCHLLSQTKDDSMNSSDVMEFSCRDIFKATSGWVIVSADYCQLEMRILAHMCSDIKLKIIMNTGIDIFKAIASSWACIPEEEVDDDLRQRAKQLCYGIIYGMGNKSISQQLDVSEIEAAAFMDSFHSAYPAIKVFTGKVITECRENGYIETLKKRRRYFPTINSAKNAEKNSAERQAVNTTIQGSAADIAKAAMCAIDEHVSLCGESSSVRLMLQLHDELIYEVLESRKEFFMETLKNGMEQAVKLSVPLPVKIKTGYSWGSLDVYKM